MRLKLCQKRREELFRVKQIQPQVLIRVSQTHQLPRFVLRCVPLPAEKGKIHCHQLDKNGQNAGLLRKLRTKFFVKKVWLRDIN